jgi:hypothetical protein
MEPITMMVASIGLQFLNNYANNKKNQEIQKKQREFQTATTEHDFERMRRLQAESAKLALELEAEVHQERVEDINNNYEALLQNFAHSFAIQNWPLNVLPFIMKGESFGSLFKGTANSVNMHCILTPSNCDWFNELFYDDIDLRLEAEMNNNWNAQTTHPVVYYGGAWNRRSMNHGISVPSLIDLDDIELLETKLKNVPVVVITPYFDQWLHFRVKLWGMGKDSDVPFRIDIPHGDDLVYSQRVFSYEYSKDVRNEMSDDFINTTIEEFVPYLESLIGFLADKYFWSMYGIDPYLPILLCNNSSLDRVKGFFSKKYHQLLSDTVCDDLSNVSKEKIVSLYSSVKNVINSNEQKQYLHNVLNAIAQKYGYCEFEKSDTFKDVFSLDDKDFIEHLVRQMPKGELHAFFNEILKNLKNHIPCLFAEQETITFVNILDYARQIMDSRTESDIKIIINDKNVVIGILDADGENIISDNDSPKCIILSYENLYIADRLQLNSSSITIKGKEFKSKYKQIKSIY